MSGCRPSRTFVARPNMMSATMGRGMPMGKATCSGTNATGIAATTNTASDKKAYTK